MQNEDEIKKLQAKLTTVRYQAALLPAWVREAVLVIEQIIPELLIDERLSYDSTGLFISSASLELKRCGSLGYLVSDYSQGRYLNPVPTTLDVAVRDISKKIRGS